MTAARSDEDKKFWFYTDGPCSDTCERCQAITWDADGKGTQEFTEWEYATLGDDDE